MAYLKRRVFLFGIYILAPTPRGNTSLSNLPEKLSYLSMVFTLLLLHFFGFQGFFSFVVVQCLSVQTMFLVLAQYMYYQVPVDFFAPRINKTLGFVNKGISQTIRSDWRIDGEWNILLLLRFTCNWTLLAGYTGNVEIIRGSGWCSPCQGGGRFDVGR
eukprot:TRINITY_DN3327_c0_g4_i1.p2 TRINITY_DN3327_c0_g4~~TRINITY_DN3327_c0_g4_i1.p2  ORF type:complete len:158 (+),score=2.56 TRINITY_DN3327_c0_g4_i1:55-528(+)